jgi:hypothetical protein
LSIIIDKPRFSHSAIAKAVNNTTTIARAAKELGRKGKGEVKVQELREWLTQMDSTLLADGFDRAKELTRSRNSQVENNKLRKDVRVLVDQLGSKQGFLDALAELADDIPLRPPVDHTAFIGAQAGHAVTVELLLSDLQIGKLSPGYNTLVARKRLFEFGRAALFQIEQKVTAGYRVERIVLGMLGDIIESDKKHANSARATDTGTSEQIFDSISGIFEFVIEPLAKLGIPMEAYCITGNHDWDDHGLNMFEPGKQQLSWPLYKSLELVTSRSGYAHVTFIIPEGSYAVTDFYGQYVLYEHGVGVSVAESSMKAHKVKRAEQEKKHLTYFRMGDKHTVTSFNSGQMVVNGAFFGAQPGGTEYSGIAGYSSVPAQWMGFHVERKDNRLSLYDSFVIQLDHIGE